MLLMSTKSEILLVNQSHKTLFGTWNFALIQMVDLLCYAVHLSNSYHLQNASKTAKNLVIYMVNHSDLFLSQMSYMNILRQTLIFNFLSLFRQKRSETFSAQSFNHSFGSRIQVFSLLGIKEASYPSFVTVAAFFPTSRKCPHVNDLILLKVPQNKSKQYSRLISSQYIQFLAHLLERHAVLA